MRFFLSALATSSLAFAPLAHAGDVADTASDSTGSGHYALATRLEAETRALHEPSEALRLGRELAMGEANLRASGLVAGVLISSVLGQDNPGTQFAVSEMQRDAVVTVLAKHHYFERLAHLYASILTLEDLREAAAMYACPSIASFWQFQSAAMAAILSMGVNMEVQLPESTLQSSDATGDKHTIPSRDSIAQLLAFWYPGIVESQLDLDALVTGIQGRTTLGGIQDVLNLSQTAVATKLSTAQANPKFNAFDRKELESPRLRYALTSAVLRTN